MASRSRPVLSVQRVSHAPTHPVTHLLASNRSVVVVMANKSVHFVDKEDNEALVDVSKYAAKILAAFIDPSGQFVVLNVAQSGTHDTLYIHKQSTSRVVVSSKLKGQVVTAVAFHTETKLSNGVVCGPLLVGTKQGLVFELELSFGAERLFASSAAVTENYCTQMLSLEGESISGLALTPLDKSKSSKESKKYFSVLLSTVSGHFYKLNAPLSSMEERPLFTPVFESALKRILQKELRVANVKQSNVITSRTIELVLKVKQSGKTAALLPLTAQRAVWMAGNQGIFHFDVNVKNLEGETPKWLDFSSLSSSQPLYFCVTRFHAVLVYAPNVLRVVCLIDNALHFETEIPDLTSALKGVVRDDVTGSIFVFADYSVHRLVVDKEERLVWKLFLDKNDFDSADEFALDDPDRLEASCLRRAEFLFANKRYEESAEYFGLVSSLSFEETALKFVRSKDDKAAIALVALLRHKLDTLRVEDKTQLTLITAWLVEIYLGKLDKSNKKWRQELVALLSEPKLRSCLKDNRSVFLKLMSAHDNVDDDNNQAVLIDFARLLKDKELQVELLLRKEDFNEVLKLVQSEPKLIYTYGTELIVNRPAQFVDVLTVLGKKVDPVKLIPSLTATSNMDKAILCEVIRYLEFCVDRLQTKETAVHNYLVALYIEVEDSDQLDKYLDDHLEPVVNSNENDHFIEPDEEQFEEKKNKPLLDLKYALRLCEEKGLVSQSVRLYCALGQMDEAVELALSLSQELAEQCVQNHVDKGDLNTRRRLWMQIARHVIKNKSDNIEEAVNCLNRSEGLVHIEDVLPFFPDFETIGPFKTIVCDALRDYNEQIETLKQEMEASSRSADLIRAEMEDLKNEAIVIKTKATCALCKTPLMRKPFHVFPCGHHVLSDCLMDAALKLVDDRSKRKLLQLRQKLKKYENKEDENSVVQADSIRDEIDDIIASECVLCGDRVIENVDKPLIDSHNFDQVLSEWV